MRQVRCGVNLNGGHGVESRFAELCARRLREQEKRLPNPFLLLQTGLAVLVLKKGRVENFAFALPVRLIAVFKLNVTLREVPVLFRTILRLATSVPRLRITIAFVAVSIAAGNCTVRANDAAKIAAKAAANSGEAVIRTAEIAFEATIEDAPPTQSDIEQSVARQKAAILEQVERNRDNPAVAKLFKDALKDNEKVVTEQVIANAKRTISGVYAIGGPLIGGDQIVEFRIRRGYEEEPGQPITLLVRRLGPSRQTTLFFDSEAGTAVANRRSVTAGISNPHFLGRLQGTVLDASRGDRGSLTFALVENPEDVTDGLIVVEAFSGEVARKNRVAKIAVDAERDFVCPLIEEYDSAGDLRIRWQSEDYFRDPESGVWFPGRCRQIVNANDETVTIDYKFDVAATSFNRDLPLARFACPIPPGTSLISDLGGGQEQWTVQDQIALTIDDLDSLSTRSDLARTEVTRLPSREDIDAASSPSSGRLWLIAGNVIAIAILAAWMLYRRRTVAVWLLASIGLGCLSSCSEPASMTDRTPSVAPGDAVRATPRRVEFGTIAADGRTLNSSIEVVNVRETGAAMIRVSAGCGCTHLGLSSYRLGAGESTLVPFQVSTTGRNGEFNEWDCGKTVMVDDACGGSTIDGEKLRCCVISQQEWSGRSLASWSISAASPPGLTDAGM